MEIKFFSGKAYKFCTIDTLQKVVKSEKLRLARADTFNDPLDVNPFLVPLEWEKLTQFKDKPFESVRSIANEAFMRICSSLYITCFSQNFLDIQSTLMWAHYADNHKGVCFEIDFPKVTTNNYSPGDSIPVNVSYVKSLADERNKRNEQSDDLPLFIVTYKSDVWKYEQEVRLVIESESFDKNKFIKIDDGKKIEVDFDISSISKVIFGLRSSTDEIENTIKLFYEKGHVPKFSMIDINPVTIEFYEIILGIK